MLSLSFWELLLTLKLTRLSNLLETIMQIEMPQMVIQLLAVTRVIRNLSTNISSHQPVVSELNSWSIRMMLLKNKLIMMHQLKLKSGASIQKSFMIGLVKSMLLPIDALEDHAREIQHGCFSNSRPNPVLNRMKLN